MEGRIHPKRDTSVSFWMNCPIPMALWSRRIYQGTPTQRDDRLYLVITDYIWCLRKTPPGKEMWSNKLKSLNQTMKQKGMTWVEN